MKKFVLLVTASVVISTVLGLAMMNYCYRLVDVAADVASDLLEAESEEASSP